jgi:hypothetical protein
MAYHTTGTSGFRHQRVPWYVSPAFAQPGLMCPERPTAIVARRAVATDDVMSHRGENRLADGGDLLVRIQPRLEDRVDRWLVRGRRGLTARWRARPLRPAHGAWTIRHSSSSSIGISTRHRQQWRTFIA